MIRLFVAIDIPDSIKEIVESHYREIQCKFKEKRIRSVKWVDPRLWHITLKFLGEIPEQKLPMCQKIIEQCGQLHNTLKLRLRHIGCFPGLQRPRVVWAGIEDNAKCLESMHLFLDKSFESIGIPREQKKFHAHLTFCRIKNSSPCVAGTLVDILKTGLETPWFEVGYISLYKSKLTPNGPIYTPITRAKLGRQ
ncbi:2'-5' RNA ligase [Dissulfuribacter thermophilus]|uniref:RNA 2',3'-cyclic phosphodiesterase n=1 Tax=Dissulfuribacter thermophilus TaxID=1156395 RepID=A0A1B9F7T9_9BACT|nr:RNA 2',3'-cyclic phosphodiesterase [Dissulfuribacter thermophilus]OCC15831.1 2'-5' RNA ligase [Dissulfuribacter thermophilus]